MTPSTGYTLTKGTDGWYRIWRSDFTLLYVVHPAERTFARAILTNLNGETA